MSKAVLSCWGEREGDIFALHGFGGDAQDFDVVAAHSLYQWSGIDLLGHGNSTLSLDPEAYRTETQLKVMEPYFQGDVLLGYSMGARLALQAVLRYPHQWQALVLISGTAGIEEDIDARILWDRALAHKLQTSTREEFWEYWSNLPIIATQKRADSKFLLQREERRAQQNPSALAASVLGFGTGFMPSVWNRLGEISIPVLLLVGEQDTKYVEIAQKLQQRISVVEVVEIKNAGHAPHFEKPQECAAVIDRWISTLLR